MRGGLANDASTAYAQASISNISSLRGKDSRAARKPNNPSQGGSSQACGAGVRFRLLAIIKACATNPALVRFALREKPAARFRYEKRRRMMLEE
jgi:hypothetical protein